MVSFVMGASAISVEAQSSKGAITPQVLQQLQESGIKSPADRALRNAITTNGLVFNNPQKNDYPNEYFAYRVPGKGITDQKSSGRCWLFTGLNVLRSQMIDREGTGEFFFSHAYSFFWDQLEKSNLFLQSIIDTKDKPQTDRTVEWLFKHPISDGGQFTGVSDILTKYGVVPSEVMPETYSSNNTGRLSSLIAKLLRQSGIDLRKKAAQGASERELQAQKIETLKVIYRLLCLNLGEPPTQFSYTLRDAQGKELSTETYTPQSFFARFVKVDLQKDYVMVMNDPTYPYYKTYSIELDRHAYDGQNWTYVNVPMEDLKEMAMASIKGGEMMYYSCDVGQQLERKKGLLTMDNFDYESVLGAPFTMNKAERIASFDSGSTHAMTLVAVDVDANGKPTKWMVENSWGADSGYKGHLIMTDEWFDAYTFRIVVNKKYITTKVADALKQKPQMLPPWSPMFAPEE